MLTFFNLSLTKDCCQHQLDPLKFSSERSCISRIFFILTQSSFHFLVLLVVSQNLVVGLKVPSPLLLLIQILSMVKIKSHVTEPKSFFLKPLLVYPDQAFSIVIIFILEDLAFHPYSSFFLRPRPNLTSLHIQLG